MLDELYAIFNSKVKGMLSKIKTQCYDRMRLAGNLTQGSKMYAQCVNRNLTRVQEMQKYEKLKLIYLQMRSDRVRDDNDLHDIVVESEYLRQTMLMEPFKVE